jgi:hypothetical protein
MTFEFQCAAPVKYFLNCSHQESAVTPRFLGPHAPLSVSRYCYEKIFAQLIRVAFAKIISRNGGRAACVAACSTNYRRAKIFNAVMTF